MYYSRIIIGEMNDFCVLSRYLMDCASDVVLRTAFIVFSDWTVVYYGLSWGLVAIHPSINQSNFYNANIPRVARFSGAGAESAFNSKID